MSFQQLLAIWPGEELEKIPSGLAGQDAASLLAHWSALWHPTFLHATGKIPKWQTTTSPAADAEQSVVVIPVPSETQNEATWRAEAVSKGAVIFDRQSNRGEIVRDLLQRFGDHCQGWDRNLANDDLANDFLALGYCFLQVELLTQKLQYSSTLDRGYFQRQAVLAAGAALSDEGAVAREHLIHCFDALAQARDHYYPVDAYILDLLLVGPTTMGTALVNELKSDSPKSVLLSARTVEQMSIEAPAALLALRESLDAGRVTLVGGEYEELPLPLCSLEMILENCQRGLDIYHQLLGHRPVVFGRRRYGLTPFLPQLLDKLGFVGALHATLDDGQFPQPDEAKVYWEGVDGSTIEAFGRVPVDASRSETFLYYADCLGDTMNLDHLATVCLAHWPGQTAIGCDDLRRIANYVPVLGKLVTLTDYLQETDYAAHSGRFDVDQYRQPYLQQSVAGKSATPISQWVDRFGSTAQQNAKKVAQSLHDILVGIQPSVEKGPVFQEESKQQERFAQKPADPGLDASFASLSGLLPRDKGHVEDGMLLWNPCGFSRRVCVETADQQFASVQPPVYCTGCDENRAQTIVDLPAVGFAWLPYGTKASDVISKPLAENNILRNEYMEVVLDPQQGTLKALYDFQHRGNRLSQQLAYRSTTARPGSGQQRTGHYSDMVADRVAVTCATAALGEITCEGRLVDRDGNTHATYRQIYQLPRGSRVLLLDVEFETYSPLGDNPWESYYAVRFAWSEESSLLCRDVAWSRQWTEAKRFEANSFVEIDAANGRTAILTGGLPFHQRTGPRYLDTLAVVQGETKRNFHLGIGLDLTHPLHEAIGLVLPPIALQNISGPLVPTSTGWFFHAAAKNILLTSLEPLYDQGSVCGFRARLLETEGRRTSCSLSFYRDVGRARKINFQGEQIVDCEIDSGSIKLEVSAYEWAQLEAHWSA